MTTHPVRLGRALAAAAALVLSGCFLLGGDSFFLGQGGGGGEDFPNTATPLAKELAKEVAASSDLAQLASLQIPDLPDLSVFGDLRIEPIGLAKGSALAKRSAEGECDTVIYDYNQLELLLDHRGRKIVCEEDSARVRRDTLLFWIRDPNPDIDYGDTAAVIKYVQDSAVLLQAWGSVSYKLENRVQTYRAWNDDSLGTVDHGDYVTTILEGPEKTVQRARLHGRDGTFEKEGWPPHWYESLKTLGRDTLDWQRMTDVDGDSALWDRNAKEAATGVVRFERKTRDPSEGAAVARMSQTLRAELRHVPGRADSLTTHWYFDQRTLRGGVKSAFAFRGAGADSVLRPHDTALVVVDTVFAASDSAVSHRASYRMLLGADPGSQADQSLLRFEVSKSWRSGKLRSSNTQFVPAAPAPMGQPLAGTLSAQTVNKDKDSVYTDGTINADGMELYMRIVSKGKVEVWRLLLDLAGNEKEPSVKLTLTNGGDTLGRQDTTRQTQSQAPVDTIRAREDSLRTPQSPARTP